MEPVPGSRLVNLLHKMAVGLVLKLLKQEQMPFCSTWVSPCNQKVTKVASLTGLFQRGTAYYLCIVLPHQHPLKNKFKNGRMISSLGRCTHRETVLKGAVRRAEVLRGLRLQLATVPTPIVTQQLPTGPLLWDVYDRWKASKPRSSDSLNNCLRSVTLYEEFAGNPPINQLTREQGDGFRTWLQHPDRKTSSKTARDLGQIDRNPWEGLDIAFSTTNKRRPGLMLPTGFQYWDCTQGQGSGN